jgi:hypothetical protein
VLVRGSEFCGWSAGYRFAVFRRTAIFHDRKSSNLGGSGVRAEVFLNAEKFSADPEAIYNFLTLPEDDRAVGPPDCAGAGSEHKTVSITRRLERLIFRIFPYRMFLQL